jgi:hypothetical protein
LIKLPYASSSKRRGVGGTSITRDLVRIGDIQESSRIEDEKASPKISRGIEPSDRLGGRGELSLASEAPLPLEILKRSASLLRLDLNNLRSLLMDSLSIFHPSLKLLLASSVPSIRSFSSYSIDQLDPLGNGSTRTRIVSSPEDHGRERFDVICDNIGFFRVLLIFKLIEGGISSPLAFGLRYQYDMSPSADHISSFLGNRPLSLLKFEIITCESIKSICCFLPDFSTLSEHQRANVSTAQLYTSRWFQFKSLRSNLPILPPKLSEALAIAKARESAATATARAAEVVVPEGISLNHRDYERRCDFNNNLFGSCHRCGRR